jgi:hypothetical protein
MMIPKEYTSPALLLCDGLAITSGACHIGLFAAGTFLPDCLPETFLHTEYTDKTDESTGAPDTPEHSAVH